MKDFQKNSEWPKIFWLWPAVGSQSWTKGLGAYLTYQSRPAFESPSIRPYLLQGPPAGTPFPLS